MKAKNKYQTTSEVGAKGTIRHRILLALAALMIVGGAIAQSQRGVVRTAQRPGKQAQKLAGVTIRLRGGNAAVTSPDGAFALGMDGARAGDALFLQSVRKIGYELVDKEIVGRALAYSPNVPIEIVMLNSREKEEDMQRIYDNAYRRAEQTYAERNAALERQLNDKTVSEEAYRQQLQELQQWFDKYQTLINDMAERYASMDYATIDTLNMAINEAIERGDMERADSLISTAGSLEKLVSECMEERQNAEQRRSVAERIAAKADADLAKNRERTRSTGELLYSKYSTSLAKQQRDTAAHCITLRAELDTTNVAWQLDAADFLCDYMADYDRAMPLCQRALRNAVAQYGEYADQTAKAYIAIGNVFYGMGRYTEARDNYKQALAISTMSHGENHPDVANAYNCLASVLGTQGNNAEALDYSMKALNILRTIYGENHRRVAFAYDGVSVAYGLLGDLRQAMVYGEKALSIGQALLGERDMNIAQFCNNIGNLYHYMGNDAQALAYYNRALDISKAILGENHPKTQLLLYNISGMLYEQKRYEETLDLARGLTEAKQTAIGEHHPDMILPYNLLGLTYSRLGNQADAMVYIEKALQIAKATFGDVNPYVAYSRSNVSLVLAAKGQFDEALATGKQAISELEQTVGLDNQMTYDCMGQVYHTYMMAMASSDNYAADFAGFMADKAFMLTTDSCTVTADGQPAGGEYWLLEVDGRDENSRDDLMEYVDSKAETAWTAIVSDGRRAIELHIGSQCISRLNMKSIERKAKEKLTDIHNKWRKKHGSKQLATDGGRSLQVLGVYKLQFARHGVGKAPATQARGLSDAHGRVQ